MNLNEIIQLEWIAKKFVVEGVDIESSRLRRINKNCTHLQFASTETFIQHTQKLLQKAKTNDKYWVAEKKMHHLIGDGFCKECSLYVAANIKEITNDEQKVLFHFGNGFTLKYVTCEEISNMSNYLCNLCHYWNTAYFMFHQSNLWVLLFNSILHYIREIEYKGQIRMEENNNIPSEAAECLPYFKLGVVLLQIIRNYHVIKAKHWHELLRPNSYLPNDSIFRIWLDFIIKQLRLKIYLYATFGVESMYCFIILIMICLKRMKTAWFTMLEQRNDFEGLPKAFDDLKHLFNDYVCNAQCGAIASLIDLEDKNDLDRLYEKFEIWTKATNKRKKENMECQYSLCHRTRKKAQLRKCKSCRVARYCSRKCQKRDWNLNHHVTVCEKLRQTRISNKEWWKRLSHES
eukprot:117258_1